MLARAKGGEQVSSDETFFLFKMWQVSGLTNSEANKYWLYTRDIDIYLVWYIYIYVYICIFVKLGVYIKWFWYILNHLLW